MKLQPLAICRLTYLPARRGELLSPSLPNSVCKRKKTSLAGRLPLPQAQLLSPPVSFSSLATPSHPPHISLLLTQTPRTL
jgi:hypothetical protein